jgi:glycosyltransferase involved in cell wall biosynthesis
MKVFIHAANVHQGGGRTLLNELVKIEKGHLFFTLDSRMPLPEYAQRHTVKQVEPTFFGRIKAEFFVYLQVSKEDILLCFGNLPPLLRSRGRVTVFLQNRYLFGPQKYDGFSLATALRLRIERWWFRALMRPEYRVVVQSETMRRELKQHIGLDSEVLPFVPTFGNLITESQAQEGNLKFDFVYVSSAEPHKNHHNLIEAWKLLAAQGVRPRLALTVNELTFPATAGFIERAKLDHGLRIENFGVLPHGQVRALYEKSNALIFPSKLESFGLPLLEANQLGLPILAPELDYVRDVIEPDQTFDPASPTSIARAVLRHLSIQVHRIEPVDAATFLARIQQQATA